MGATNACGGGSGQNDVTSSTNNPLSTTLPIKLYNCTWRQSVDVNNTAIDIKNLTSYNTICKVVTNTSDAELSNLTEYYKVTYCNHLGRDVCPKCFNDSSYAGTWYSIKVNCWQDETTTITTIATTVPTTNTEYVSTGVNFPTTSDGTSPQTKSGPLGTTDIVIIIIAGVVSILIAVLVIFSAKKKCTDGKEIQGKKNGNNGIVRFEANSTGDMCTTVNRDENNENLGNVVDAYETSPETAEAYATVNAKDAASRANSGNETTYNVLYQPNEPNEDNETYSTARV